jgi:hypothetical protein
METTINEPIINIKEIENEVNIIINKKIIPPTARISLGLQSQQ